jgi:hypothetical protein
LVVGLPFAFATVDPRAGDYFWSFEAGMSLWAMAAYVLATLGMKRARTGSAEDAQATPLPPALASAPFASASAARRWYELRRTTPFFCKTFAIAPLPFVALCVLAVCFPNSVFAYRMGAGVPIAVTWAEIYLVLGPLLGSAALGGYVARFDHAQKPGLTSFFALRPVSTTRLVADKLVSAGFAAAILFASSAVIAVFAFWAYAANAPPRVHAILDRLFSGSGLVDAALVALAFALLLWRNLAVDLWTTMSGRVWPSRVVACYAGLTVAILPVAMASLRSHPDLLALLPLLARVLVVNEALRCPRDRTRARSAPRPLRPRDRGRRNELVRRGRRPARPDVALRRRVVDRRLRGRGARPSRADRPRAARPRQEPPRMTEDSSLASLTRRIRASIEAYIAAWNERDAAPRMRLIEQACAEDLLMRTPGKRIHGRGELDALMADFQARRPGARAVLSSAIDVQGHVFRYAGVVEGSTIGGETLDAGEADDDGRIRVLLTFVGASLPPRT